MNFQYQIVLTCFLLFSCKKSTSFHNNSGLTNQLKDQESYSQEPYQEKRDISKNDLEDISAGDGLTVGNGQNAPTEP